MQRHFASEEEIRSCTVNVDINRAIRALNEGEGWERAHELCPAGGPVVRCNADGTMQVMNDDSHSVTFASTGRGKTRRFVYPTMFADICAGANLVVNDMKGEIYATTRGLLEAAGYTVYVLDLRDPGNSPNRYNPLDIAWTEWNAGRQDSAFMYLRNFALSVFDTMSKTTNDAFWPNSAIDYFMGLALGMLEVGASREEFTLDSLATMDRLGNDGSLGGTRLKRFFGTFPSDSLALQSASGTINAPNDTRSSILSVFRSPMALYAGQRGLMDALSRSDFDVHELTLERRALFVISPDETHAFGPVVVGILNQVMSAMISTAQREYGGVLPHRVDFILDEMGNLPSRIPDMEALVSAARSRNMRFHFVLQSAAQLSNVYGNELREVILDNCDTWVYMGSRGLDFLKRISDLTGEVQLESGRVRPLMSVEKLQHLETRETETETLVFLSSLKPFVAPLKDVGQYEKPAEPVQETHVKEPVERKVFDLEQAIKEQGMLRAQSLIGAEPDREFRGFGVPRHMPPQDGHHGEVTHFDRPTFSVSTIDTSDQDSLGEVSFDDDEPADDTPGDHDSPEDVIESTSDVIARIAELLKRSTTEESGTSDDSDGTSPATDESDATQA